MIVQDMIPGDDSRMRVLTAYSDRDGKVKMTCLGHVILEEHTPKGRGNHAAILIEPNKALTDRYRALLNDRATADLPILTSSMTSATAHCGPLKSICARDGATITSHQQASTLPNWSPATTSPTRNCLTWIAPTNTSGTACPGGVVKRYGKDDALIAKAAALRRAGKATSALWCHADLRGNPKRLIWVVRHLLGHYVKYRKYCK